MVLGHIFFHLLLAIYFSAIKDKPFSYSRDI